MQRSPRTVRRLGLVLSGAVSLGSFEAGVLDELLHGLGQRVARGAQRFEIDVVAGASAGAMTGALLARTLMASDGAQSPLHDAWVESVDLRALLEGAPPHALLSAEVMRTMATRYMGPPPPASVRAPYAAAELHLSFALSNLNGVDYKLPVRFPDAPSFLTTRFRDRRRFRLSSTSVSNRSIWTAVGEAAIASGSFPAVFEPTVLPSAGAEYGEHAHGALPPTFSFLDGGMFDNEPIGEAIHLARMAEGEGPSLSEGRVFLLVDAHLNQSDHDRYIGPTTELSDLLLRLGTMIRRQASASDWLRAGRVNNEVRWRDELASALSSLLRSVDVTVLQAMAPNLRRAAEDVVETKRALLGEERYGDRYLIEALARTRAREETVFEALPPPTAEVLGWILFLLNSASGLDHKEHIDIGLIHADSGETAGDRIGGFGGFFKREWREHDYRVGRRKAAALLPEILGVERWEPEPGVDYHLLLDPELVRMSDVDAEIREQVRARVLERARASTYAFADSESALMRWILWRATKSKLDSHLSQLLELD